MTESYLYRSLLFCTISYVSNVAHGPDFIISNRKAFSGCICWYLQEWPKLSSNSPSGPLLPFDKRNMHSEKNRGYSTAWCWIWNLFYETGFFPYIHVWSMSENIKKNPVSWVKKNSIYYILFSSRTCFFHILYIDTACNTGHVMLQWLVIFTLWNNS